MVDMCWRLSVISGGEKSRLDHAAGRIRRDQGQCNYENARLDRMEIPTEFLDALTHTLMEYPVKLPAVPCTVDQATLDKLVDRDTGTAKHPYTRAKFYPDHVERDITLQEAIKAFRRKHLL